MSVEQTLQWISISLAILFAFISGFHDGGNVIATVVASRSMQPGRAIAIAALSEFLGAVILGTAVAKTMALGILRPEFMAALSAKVVQLIIIGGVGGAVIWKLATWVLGLPSSGSHALVGGLIGAGVIGLGIGGVDSSNVLKSVIAPMLLSPLLGAVIGLTLFAFIRRLFGHAHRSVGNLFALMQYPTLCFLAGSHGSNDAQKAMGIIAIALCEQSTVAEQGGLPYWVILACAGAISLGMSTGGLRIVKTVGYGIYRLEPVHSFSSQLTSSSVILAASILGGPVSATQIISSSVMGVGAAGRFTGVRWPTAVNIAYAWFLTLPISVVLGGAGFMLLNLVL